MKKNKFVNLIGLLLLVILFSNNSFSQRLSIKDRWNIKTGFSYYSDFSKVANYRIECNYGIKNMIEIGGYIGFSNLLRVYNIKNPIDSLNKLDIIKTPTFFYGINFNFQLLPLFVVASDYRFDLYLTAKIGGLLNTNNTLDFINDGYHEEIAIGPGIVYYPWRHVGLFVEYNWGRFYYMDNKKLRFGVSIKLKNN